MNDQVREAGHQAADICLVTMPYAALPTPSIALGLLKAILADAGISATVAYANLWFAETVGLHHYELCSSKAPTVFLMGEWTFAAAAFGDDPRRAERDAEYLRQIYAATKSYPDVWRGPRGEAMLADLRVLREEATRFIDEAARRVLATGARVVGCTSTFEQHVASLALLRRIRELDPDVITMLGGANCETTMGAATHRCFDWVDFVVSGEADGLIADVCRLALTKGRDVPAADLPPGVLGPAHRDQGATRPGPGGKQLARALFNDLDGLPTPRFDDYFDQLAGSPLREFIRPGIPLETSRGCWWGAVHHCTFCGLNGTSLGYRSKSPERVLAEIHELEDRHGVSSFEAVDNILDMDYIRSLLPKLAAERADGANRRLFYEIKANVTRAQAQSLADAGITWVQPGIESLHSDVLRLMDKGVQGWQNIQLLKWGRQLGLRLSWSILWGFPDEKDDWYEDMAGWLPALEHLQPPASTPRIRFDRYSVYHEQARARGLVLFPIGATGLIYPVWPADLDALTYFFATEPAAGPLRYIEAMNEEIARLPGIRALVDGVRRWGRAYRDGRLPELSGRDAGGVLHITDTRGCARQRTLELTGLHRAVCLACDRAPRPGKLRELLRVEYAVDATEEEIAAAIGDLVNRRLVLALDGRLAGLVLSAPVPAFDGPSRFPGGHVAMPDNVRVGAEPR